MLPMAAVLSPICFSTDPLNLCCWIRQIRSPSLSLSLSLSLSPLLSLSMICINSGVSTTASTQLATPVSSISRKLNFSPHEHVPGCVRFSKLERRRQRLNVEALGRNPAIADYALGSTVFPGGFRRPKIKIPSVILKLGISDVLRCSDVIDQVLSRGFISIVVLRCEDDSGGQIYEAACVLKSLIRDRAYFLVSERVDIAAAVGASGVVLSDQGLFLDLSYFSYICILFEAFDTRECCLIICGHQIINKSKILLIT